MASVRGTARDDTLHGTEGDDSFDGLEGSDTVVVRPDRGSDAYADSGLSGWDRIVAVGNGTVIGLASGFGPDSGIEEISGGGFAHVGVTGTDGDDLLDFRGVVLTDIAYVSGGSGRDTVIGSQGGDDIRGDNRSDTLMGMRGDDMLLGGGLNDLAPRIDDAHAADGRDVLFGGAGDDRLAGGAGSDRLQGGRGRDTLQGGSGVDTLNGGLGHDVFVFASVDDGGDLIEGFRQGRDLIDLSRIDADAGSILTDEAFAFAGPSRTVQAHSISFVIHHGQTIILADTNGDAQADFVLKLDRSIALTAADFLL